MIAAHLSQKMSLSEDVVPLARAIGDIAVNFKEQVHELAFTYNMNPVTLSQVAANHMSGKSNEKCPVLCPVTPASVCKTQPSTHSRPVISTDANHASIPSQVAAETFVINPLPADVQRVIAEHIVKHDSPVHHTPTRELRLFSGNSPKPPTEVDYSVWWL